MDQDHREQRPERQLPRLQRPPPRLRRTEEQAHLEVPQLLDFPHPCQGKQGLLRRQAEVPAEGRQGRAQEHAGGSLEEQVV